MSAFFLGMYTFGIVELFFEMDVESCHAMTDLKISVLLVAQKSKLENAYVKLFKRPCISSVLWHVAFR